MQESRWQKIEEIFNRAAVLPIAERRAFIEDVCREDEELCREVLALIENDSAENSFLDEPVFNLGAQLLEDDFSTLLEKDFASYKLKKLLGRGGMGAVFLAEDPRLGRAVAVKILPSGIAENIEAISRFRQEAKAASAISHQNIAHIYEFGETDGRRFLAMEYVEGQTLRELLKDNSVNLVSALDIIRQIADALAATHRRGIIHRDIKPENIIITENGLAKILDFGLAKINLPLSADGKVLASLETTPGLIIGTTAYMSPEQIRAQSLDTRTDLWSLGVLLFEMLAGERPFAGETSSDIQAAILLKDAPLLTVRTDLAVIVGKLLKKNPDERYQTAEEFLSNLRDIKTIIDEKKQEERFSRNSKTSKIGFPASETVSGKREFFSQSVFLKVLLPFILFVGAAFSTIYYNDEISRTFRRESSVSQTRQEKISSLVVLPFRNETENNRINFLSEGLAEDLTRSFGKLNHFRVISFSSARKLREVSGLSEIKNRVNADAVLRGAVRRENNQIIVAVELLETDSGAVLWSNSVQTADTDLLKLRNALTILLSTDLQNYFGTEKKMILSEYSTRNEMAYRHYLEGKYASDRSDAAGTKRAVENLERAVRLDADYTQAHIALAETYNLLGAWFGEKPEVYLPKAKRAVEKAVALDETSAEARTILAKMKMDYDRDWTQAEKQFRRAVELNPNYALAHHWFGEVYLSAMGRFDESIRELETAHALDPLSSGILTGLAWAHIGAKDYEKAAALCEKAVALNPKRAEGYAYLAMAQMKLGKFGEALANAKRADEIDGDLALLGIIYALQGNLTEAEKILSELKKQYAKGETNAYHVAVVEGALGRRDRAFALLEKDFAKTSADLLSIRVDPLLDSLRHDKRFAALEARFKFPPLSIN